MSYVHMMMPSPVGTLKLVASDAGLAAILWENDDPGRVCHGDSPPVDRNSILLKTERELREYFAGERTRFSVPLDPIGTNFQIKVWRALIGIPYGQTRSYGQLARQLGNAPAVRAVGAANGRNPISIIVPCHRVIGKSGELVGFAGGLETKQYLLTLERSPTPQYQMFSKHRATP